MDELYKHYVGELGLPHSEFYLMDLRELGLFGEGRQASWEREKEWQAHVVTVGYGRTQTKKKISLFNKKEKKRKKQSKEELEGNLRMIFGNHPEALASALKAHGIGEEV